MKGNKVIEYPQIRYHITYDENLTFKDLEDLLHIIRISNNDFLHEMGVNRHVANDLQKIEQIEPGSIEIIIETIKEIMEVVNDATTVITALRFVQDSVKVILNKIRARRDRPNRNPREDRKVYDKCEVIVEVEERQSAFIYVVHIHICNRNFMN